MDGNNLEPFIYLPLRGSVTQALVDTPDILPYDVINLL
jgi:hypothetical protein